MSTFGTTVDCFAGSNQAQRPVYTSGSCGDRSGTTTRTMNLHDILPINFDCPVLHI